MADHVIPLVPETVQSNDFFKLILIGDAGVGKSSLICRFTDNNFPKNYISTIGLDFRIHNVKHQEQPIKLHIWDTAGHERFKAITNAYYRGTQGVIIVYDCSNKETFENVRIWLDDVRRGLDNEPVFALIGNKCDLVEKSVTDEEAETFASDNNMLYFETSAKFDQNVTSAFMGVVERIIHRFDPIREISNRLDSIVTDNTEIVPPTCCGMKKIFREKTN